MPTIRREPQARRRARAIVGRPQQQDIDSRDVLVDSGASNQQPPATVTCQLCGLGYGEGALATFCQPDKERQYFVHTTCYQLVGPTLYSIGVVPWMLCWMRPLPARNMILWLSWLFFLRVAEVVSGHLMEYEMTVFVFMPIVWVTHLWAMIVKGEPLRTGLPGFVFLSTIISFRDINGIMPEETNWLVTCIWHISTFFCFSSAYGSPALFCVLVRNALSCCTGVAFEKLGVAECCEAASVSPGSSCQQDDLASSSRCQQDDLTSSSKLAEQQIEIELCCICLEREALYVGSTCTHGSVLCDQCRRKLVQEKLQALNVHRRTPMPGDLTAKHLQKTIVACPICRQLGPLSENSNKPIVTLRK